MAAAPSATLPKFDQRTDITQIGVLALSLILGRLLTDDEFPDGVGDVLATANGISAQGGTEPLPHGIRSSRRSMRRPNSTKCCPAKKRKKETISRATTRQRNKASGLRRAR